MLPNLVGPGQISRIGSIASLTLMGLCLGSPAGAAPAPWKGWGAPSAQSAWHTAREANRRGDYRSYINVISPEAHEECICQLASILSGAIGYELLEPEEGDLDALNKILARYGVLNAEAPAFRADSLKAPGLWGRAAISRIPDKAGLYHSVMRYLRKRKIGPKLPSLLTLELSDVVVEGPKATARLSGNPRLRPEAKQVSFDRRGDAWYVHLPPICLNDLPDVDQP